MPTKYTNFEDVFYCDGQREMSVLFAQILPWNTLILGCSRGVELVVIGEVPGKAGQYQFNLEESSRAEMPYVDGESSFPVGIAVDYTFMEPFFIGPEKSLPPSPVVFVLTSANVLCSYRLINTEKSDTIVNAIQELQSPPATRTKSVIPSNKSSDFVKPNIFGDSSFLTNSSNPSKPSLFSSSISAPSNPTTIGASTGSQFSALPSLSSTSTASKSNLFGSPAPTLKSKPVAEITSSEKAKDKVTFTVPPTNNVQAGSFTVPPTSNLQAGSFNLNTSTALDRKMGVPAAVNPTAIEPKAVLATQKAVQSSTKPKEAKHQAVLDSVFTKRISDEVKIFEKQMFEHKEASNCLATLKDFFNNESLKLLNNQTKDLQISIKAINDSLCSVRNDIDCEKDTHLIALASLEEAKGSFSCYNDPSYIALLKSKPLDKMTRKLRDDLTANFAQMQNLVDELNLQLDNEWEDMYSEKKTTPSSRTIYKTLAHQRTISNKQEKHVQTLINQLSNLKMDTSLIADPNTTGMKPISPLKKKQLKGFFDGYTPKTRTVTSPAKFNITSSNRAPSKPNDDNSIGNISKVNSVSKENVNFNAMNYPNNIKYAVPTLKYNEKPKFDINDPTKLLDDDERQPSVVIKYMPNTPPSRKDEFESVRGAQEVISQLMDFAQKGSAESPTTENPYSQQFIPVMRTLGPVAPGQAPNAVIQPVSTVASEKKPTTEGKLFSSNSLFGVQPSLAGANSFTSLSCSAPAGGTSLFAPTNANSSSFGNHDFKGLFSPIKTKSPDLSAKGTTSVQFNARKDVSSLDLGFPVVGVAIKDFDKRSSYSSSGSSLSNKSENEDRVSSSTVESSENDKNNTLVNNKASINADNLFGSLSLTTTLSNNVSGTSAKSDFLPASISTTAPSSLFTSNPAQMSPNLLTAADKENPSNSPGSLFSSQGKSPSTPIVSSSAAVKSPNSTNANKDPSLPSVNSLFGAKDSMYLLIDSIAINKHLSSQCQYIFPNIITDLHIYVYFIYI